MDRPRGEFAGMRARYGTPSGTDRISVFGTQETDYEVRAIVSGLAGEHVNVTHAARIGTGEVHEYSLDVPESGDGSMTRVTRSGPSSGRLAAAGAGTAGGLAAGALGYRYLREWRRRGARTDRRPYSARGRPERT